MIISLRKSGSAGEQEHAVHALVMAALLLPEFGTKLKVANVTRTVHNMKLMDMQ